MTKNCVTMIAYALRVHAPPVVIAILLELSVIGKLFAAEPPLTIEHLLNEGWEIAGYAGTLDNRSALILFRNKDKKYLVQCSTLYDVTRTSRITLNCYELH